MDWMDGSIDELASGDGPFIKRPRVSLSREKKRKKRTRTSDPDSLRTESGRFARWRITIFQAVAFFWSCDNI
jgi:hypothetical protein